MGLRGVDARQGGQLERQHLRTRHIAVVVDARELAQRQLAFFVQDAAFGAHPSKRGPLASQIGQILGGFRAEFDGSGRGEHLLEFDDGRRCPPAFRYGLQVSAMRIAQAQRAHAAEVVDRTEVVELGQCAQLGVFRSALGVCASDDPTTPRIRLGVCEGKEEK